MISIGLDIRIQRIHDEIPNDKIQEKEINRVIGHSFLGPIIYFRIDHIEKHDSRC